MSRGPDIGKLGELQLDRWATEAGLAINKAFEDKTGWDYFLEWPLEYSTDESRPLDRIRSPLQCFVQVKATTVLHGRWRVKLSNWLRFVKAPLPCFFLLLVLDQEGRCEGATLVHVDSGRMSKVLRRLRELTDSGKGLNRSYITLKAGDGVPLEDLSGKGLEAALRATIGDDLKGYIDVKTEAREDLGYEDSHGELKVSFRAPIGTDPAEMLVDFSLGLIQELEIASGEFTDTRFGIAVPNPDLSAPEGSKLRISKPEPLPGKIVVERPDGAEKVILQSQVSIPSAVAGVVDRSYLKIRATVPFVDFIWRPWGPGACSINFQLPDEDETHPLSDFASVARLVLFLRRGVSSGEPARLHLYVKGERIASGILTLGAVPPDPLYDWAKVVEGAYTVARHYAIDSDASTSIRHLMLQKGRLQVLQTVVTAPRRSLRFAFTLNHTIEDDNNDWCIPGATEVRLGDYTIQTSWRLLGRPVLLKESSQEPRYELTSSNVQLDKETIVIAPDTLEASIQDLIDAIVAHDEDIRTVIEPVGVFC